MVLIYLINDYRPLSIDRRPLCATTPHDVTVYKPYLFLEIHNCKSAPSRGGGCGPDEETVKIVGLAV